MAETMLKLFPIAATWADQNVFFLLRHMRVMEAPLCGWNSTSKRFLRDIIQDDIMPSQWLGDFGRKQHESSSGNFPEFLSASI